MSVDELLAEVDRRAGGDARRKWQMIQGRVHLATDSAFASDNIRLAMRFRSYDLAQQELEASPFDDVRRPLEQADILIHQGRHRQARALLPRMAMRYEEPEFLTGLGRRYWKLSVDCYANLGQLDAAENAARRWQKTPKREGAAREILLTLARAHMRNGNKEAGLHYYERTVALHASDTILLEDADALLLARRAVEARMLDNIVCKTRGAYMRKEELMLYLPPTQTGVE